MRSVMWCAAVAVLLIQSIPLAQSAQDSPPRGILVTRNWLSEF